MVVEALEQPLPRPSDVAYVEAGLALRLLRVD